MAKKTEYARLESFFAKADNEVKKKHEAQMAKKKSSKEKKS